MTARSPIQTRRTSPSRRPTALRIATAFPTRAFFVPGEAGSVRVRLSAPPPGPALLHVTVASLTETVVQAHTTLSSPEGEVSFPLPTQPGAGYGVSVELRDPASGRLLDTRATALDVQRTWVDAPRYGVLCEFSPGETYGERTNQLLRRHINVVQFYDWMYRHYQYLPPTDTFTDVLGRTLSISSVERAIAAVQQRGMAAFAYGSVYGAEAEYALQHPDELLYDATGKPLCLANLFYLQDVRPGPWRDHILGQYQVAVKGTRYNGIHADQYGIEDDAYDSHGVLVPWGPAFAGFIDAAQTAVQSAGGNGIIFNFVNNWPIDQAGTSRQLCTYIEVWPPHITLHDLFSLIRGAKQIAPERQVILAAYMSCAAHHPDRALAATLFTAAAIAASGGFHLLLVEGNGILADSYYPRFVRPGAAFQERLVEMQDFLVRYGAYLFDRGLSYQGEPHVRAGKVWALHRAGTDFDTVSLLNTEASALWDAIRPAPSPGEGITVDVPLTDQPQAVYLAAPGPQPDAVSVPFVYTQGRLRFAVPSLEYWTLAIIPHPSKG